MIKMIVRPLFSSFSCNNFNSVKLIFHTMFLFPSLFLLYLLMLDAEHLPIEYPILYSDQVQIFLKWTLCNITYCKPHSHTDTLKNFLPPIAWLEEDDLKMTMRWENILKLSMSVISNYQWTNSIKHISQCSSYTIEMTTISLNKFFFKNFRDTNVNIFMCYALDSHY